MLVLISYNDFLKEMIYPVFINGIDFYYEDLNRTTPKWWWSFKTKNAFYEGKFRLNELYGFRLSSYYSIYPPFDRFYKIRDFLNTGYYKNFPQESDITYNFSNSSNYWMNQVLNGG